MCYTKNLIGLCHICPLIFLIHGPLGHNICSIYGRFYIMNNFRWTKKEAFQLFSNFPHIPLRVWNTWYKVQANINYVMCKNGLIASYNSKGLVFLKPLTVYGIYDIFSILWCVFMTIFIFMFHHIIFIITTFAFAYCYLKKKNNFARYPSFPSNCLSTMNHWHLFLFYTSTVFQIKYTNNSVLNFKILTFRKIYLKIN